MAERASLAVSNAPGSPGPITAEDMRLGLSAGFVPAGPTGTRSGFRPSSPAPAVVSASETADRYVHVAPFQRVQQSARGSGAYIMTMEGTKTLDVLTDYPAHPSQPTRHLVIAYQLDVQHGDPDSLMRVVLVPGVAGANTDPSLDDYPDHCAFARLTIPANATTVTNAMIEQLPQDDARWTVALGGLLPVESQGERDAIFLPYNGFQVWRRDTRRMEVWHDPGGWRPQGIVICTSTTRPPTPYQGLEVYETDLGVKRMWDGSAWRAVDGGRSASAVSKADHFIGSAFGSTGPSVTLTTYRSGVVAKVTATFDWRLTATGTGYCYGAYSINGTTQGRQILFTATAVETRLPGTLTDRVVLDGPGTYTFASQDRKDAANAQGNAVMMGAGSSILVEIDD